MRTPQAWLTESSGALELGAGEEDSIGVLPAERANSRGEIVDSLQLQQQQLEAGEADPNEVGARSRCRSGLAGSPVVVARLSIGRVR